MACQTWLITGASSGFGAFLAESALKAGYSVIATARNPTKAASDYPQIASLGGQWLQLDVTRKGTKEQIEEAIKDSGGRIDVVINNAGYGLLGGIEDISLVRVIKAALPFMRAQRSGTNVNISSIAGVRAGPSSVAYSMSKFAVEALSESLSAEIAALNIRVLLVEPGAFRTNFIGGHKVNTVGMNKDYEGTPLAAAMEMWDTFGGNSPASLQKPVQRILDVIQLQGMGKDKGHLLRLPLGTDCFPLMLEKLDTVKQNLEEMNRHPPHSASLGHVTFNFTVDYALFIDGKTNSPDLK